MRYCFTTLAVGEPYESRTLEFFKQLRERTTKCDFFITTTNDEYVSTAIQIGSNKTLFNTIRNKLVQTCLQRNPRNPYWDMNKYINEM